MEYLSPSDNPNNRDSIPSEVLQQAHDTNAAPDTQGDSAWVSRGEESDNTGTESGQRSRKKQRIETNEYGAIIDTLRQEIAEVKERLSSTSNHSKNAAYELGKKCIEAKQIASTLKRKLAEHSHWLQRVSSLMETAPLLDYALGTSGEQSEQAQKDYNSQQSLEVLGKWIKDSKNKPQPRFLLDERLHAALIVAQDNASRLLRDAARNLQSFQLSLEFESHGWKIATGVLMTDNISFSCHRVLSTGVNNKTKDVAMAFWNFIEHDEIFRTFVPIVQDSIITHQETDCSLSCRVLQFSPEMNQQAVATVESISSTCDKDGQENSWQISMEAVHDHYLCTFVADAVDDLVIPKTAPSVKLDLGLQMSKLNMHNKFIMGVRVTTTEEGVDILVVGAARFDLPCYRDPAFDLLQHFVSHLPVYEDLHLTPLNSNQASDVLP
ncbi:unnamed protein product [Peronospora belbahrii]|uniref:Uncharacterized protein n=1 Tax=Peronospora belbahrii TaxID=622444 RepID=A0AAU9KR51_9STRA|nr:unnamed protein product [Peronospora belbahrii]CAH0518918.1 unnamed protein product [Peronospora belbahrii]